MTNSIFCDLAKLLGRVLLALPFILAGWAKIGGYAGTQAYMESAGVPGILLPLVIIVELIGGLGVLVGWFTRWWALALAFFCLATAILFHFVPGDQGEMQSFMKNIAIAGGFFILACAGAGRMSMDHHLHSK
ncbi:DoxX family protein [Microbulbifer thermotolerans]|uniref:DoxX family protein n=1 Tax=Microbulbifer thermotolerans TaxID=252514 RepID=A0A143HRK4_MICTH|nr:DoxX family protein [Microbulbifer thermotolerans]AMX03902.1 DoxX family protein [Microbulbifer thermotolerans]MCX2778576.1 DoxX family protein [Microbulbifer thermotolerans]MCX2782877.1 DoxX family protein [Microbulbifer thermotolerans]MCX2794052.1 DoxX family protein [Microbulbifer thermotolerans]MCX2801761.1 DoxX family protein [Microbulbifer thermotolerans]